MSVLRSRSRHGVQGMRGLLLALLLDGCVLPNITLLPLDGAAARDATHETASDDTGTTESGFDAEAAVESGPGESSLDAPDIGDTGDRAFDAMDAFDAFDASAEAEAHEAGAEAGDAPAPRDASEAGDALTTDGPASREGGSEGGGVPVCSTRASACGAGLSACSGLQPYCGACSRSCGGCMCRSELSVSPPIRLLDTEFDPGTQNLVADAALDAAGNAIVLLRASGTLRLAPPGGIFQNLSVVPSARPRLLVVRIQPNGAATELFRLEAADDPGALEASRAFIRVTRESGDVIVAWAASGEVTLTHSSMTESHAPTGADRRAFLTRLRVRSNTVSFANVPAAAAPSNVQVFGLEVAAGDRAIVGTAKRSDSTSLRAVGMEVHTFDAMNDVLDGVQVDVSSMRRHDTTPAALAVDGANNVYLLGTLSDDAAFYSIPTSTTLSPPPSSLAPTAFLWKLAADGHSIARWYLRSSDGPFGTVHGMGVDFVGRLHAAIETTTSLSLFDQDGTALGATELDRSALAGPGRVLSLRLDLARGAIDAFRYLGPFDRTTDVGFAVGVGGEEIFSGAATGAPPAFELADAESGRLRGTTDDFSDETGLYGSIDDEGAVRYLLSITGTERDRIEGFDRESNGAFIAWGRTDSATPMLRRHRSTGGLSAFESRTAFLFFGRE